MGKGVAKRTRDTPYTLCEGESRPIDTFAAKKKQYPN